MRPHYSKKSQAADSNSGRSPRTKRSLAAANAGLVRLLENANASIAEQRKALATGAIESVNLRKALNNSHILIKNLQRRLCQKQQIIGQKEQIIGQKQQIIGQAGNVIHQTQAALQSAIVENTQLRTFHGPLCGIPPPPPGYLPPPPPPPNPADLDD
jgi:hypothetical protein